MLPDSSPLSNSLTLCAELAVVKESGCPGPGIPFEAGHLRCSLRHSSLPLCRLARECLYPGRRHMPRRPQNNQLAAPVGQTACLRRLGCLPLLSTINLFHDADLVLHVVSSLMRYHICLSKVTWSAITVSKISRSSGLCTPSLSTGAIKRSNRGIEQIRMQIQLRRRIRQVWVLGYLGFQQRIFHSMYPRCLQVPTDTKSASCLSSSEIGVVGPSLYDEPGLLAPTLVLSLKIIPGSPPFNSSVMISRTRPPIPPPTTFGAS